MFQNLINKIRRNKVAQPVAPQTVRVWDENDDDEDDFTDAQWDAALDASWTRSADLPFGDAFAGANR